MMNPAAGRGSMIFGVVLLSALCTAGCSATRPSPYTSNVSASPLTPTISPARHGYRQSTVAVPTNPESRLSDDAMVSFVLTPAYSPIR